MNKVPQGLEEIIATLHNMGASVKVLGLEPDIGDEETDENKRKIIAQDAVNYFVGTNVKSVRKGTPEAIALWDYLLTKGYTSKSLLGIVASRQFSRKLSEDMFAESVLVMYESFPEKVRALSAALDALLNAVNECRNNLLETVLAGGMYERV